MITIFPINHLEANCIPVYKSMSLFHEDPNTRFDEILKQDFTIFPSGKDAIRAIAMHLNLKRLDEVYITTTCDSSYVSTCVSATLFNFCRISRVLTESTKAIFAIHTFCFPHPDLERLRQIADEKGIPLIEDCISAFDSYTPQGIRLGSIGDFAVYSLKKIFPVNYGGLLTSRGFLIKGIEDAYLHNALKQWTPFLKSMFQVRQNNYNYLQKHIGKAIYGTLRKENPFMYGLQSSESEFIMKKYLDCEFGRTHVPGEVHIPTHPFIDLKQYDNLISVLTQ
jgi:hypothetical protein